MSKGAIWVIIIVLIAGGFWLFSRTGNDVAPVDVQRPVDETEEGPREGSQVAEEVVVTYTDEGFSPAEVRVSAGTAVRFVNQSSQLMWTASGPHPTHTGLPEFDAQEGIAAGQSYSFVFRQTGTWPYHNHLVPTHFGRVIVE